MPERLTGCVLALVVAGLGCADFPCSTDATSRPLEVISFGYDREARYTYWYEDGAQRVVFSRDEVPETARHAVLIHLPDETSGELHGAIGWTADVSGPQAVATRAPMASTRARAFAAWSGEWTAQWLRVNAEVTVARQALRADAQNGQDATDDTIESGADQLKEELFEQGIAMDELDLQRALRNVATRRPAPRDFGLSMEIEPAWLFIDPDCQACEAASVALDAQGIGHHSMLVTDPTNAATLRSLTGDAKAVVPTLWLGSTLVSGFDEQIYEKLEETP